MTDRAPGRAPRTKSERLAARAQPGSAPAQQGRAATEPITAGTRAFAPSATAPSRGRLILLIAAAVAVVAIAIAASTILGGPGRKVETGIVVSVHATGLTAVQGFSIRTIDGRTVDFRIDATENASTFPPGHLAEHKVTLVPIQVTYIDRDGSHLALRIEDAP